MATDKPASIQVEYLLFADYAFNAEGGKHSVIGMFDRINSPGFPTRHPIMCVAVRLQGQPGHIAPVEITVTEPNGSPIAALPEQLVPLGPDGSVQASLTFEGLVFPAPGRYTISVISRGEVLASKTLTLAQLNTKTGVA
jgi:hypothetical protein